MWSDKVGLHFITSPWSTRKELKAVSVLKATLGDNNHFELQFMSSSPPENGPPLFFPWDFGKGTLYEENIIREKNVAIYFLLFSLLFFSYIFETFFPFTLHRYYCHHSLGKLRPLFLLSRLLKRLLPKRTFFCQLMGLWGKLGTIWNTIEIAEWNALKKKFAFSSVTVLRSDISSSNR